MQTDRPENKQAASSDWGAQNSQTFIDYGRYFVPEREQQIETICVLIPPRNTPFNILELCCGEGLLARALLDRIGEPCRSLLEMVYIKEFVMEAVAENLGLPSEGAARKRKFDCLQKMKELLK